MRELNHAVYYTTAQVKDMVELSDQNVRKYVRLLEDRDYEVAKDEHNRRLFSQDDVAVLKEFIKLAKKPGYTLETAAEEIIEKVPLIVSEQAGNLPSNVTNNDINRMLGAVMEKLETMQQENRELKDNVYSLVERLEQYTNYNQPAALGYQEEFSETEAASDEEERTADDAEESSGPTLEPAPDVEENVEAGETEEKQPTGNIDMNDYGEAAGNCDNDDHKSEENVYEEQSEKKEEEKGGYFSKLFSIFKSK